jgi:hypothetical protein
MIPAEFQRALDLLDAGDASGLAAHLAAHPALIRQRVDWAGAEYLQRPSLLEFIAENPVRHGTLPANAVELAQVLLDAGARDDAAALNATLALVASGRVPRECGVQEQLLQLLCDAGADPAGALSSALAHGEFAAAGVLLERGARVTLPAAAALGREEEVRRMLPSAGAGERRAALALAAQHGRTAVVAALLDAGEAASGFNPPGFHAHSTPVHQAAAGGHLATLRLLAERGADLSARDSVYGGTPLDWAAHAGRSDVAAYLNSRAAG